jgi:hypothetical protein
MVIDHADVRYRTPDSVWRRGAVPFRTWEHGGARNRRGRSLRGTGPTDIGRITHEAKSRFSSLRFPHLAGRRRVLILL